MSECSSPSTARKITVPKASGLDFTRESNDVLLVAGFVQADHSVGVQVANVSAWAQHKGKETKIIHFDDGNTGINVYILKDKTTSQGAFAPVILQGGLWLPRNWRGTEVTLFGESFKMELKLDQRRGWAKRQHSFLP